MVDLICVSEAPAFWGGKIVTLRNNAVGVETVPERTSGASCQACPGACWDACFNDAIVEVAGGGYRVDEGSCAGCGACISACDLGYIRIQQGVARIVKD
jgi:Fe-S-cluster-containing hydrogenase component 2